MLNSVDAHQNNGPAQTSACRALTHMAVRHSAATSEKTGARANGADWVHASIAL